MLSGYSIGAFARAAGVNVETVRYYERRRLLDQPVRPHGCIRRYGDAEMERLRFIKRAQSAGFSLDEVEALLKFQRDQCCQQTRDLAAAKLRMIETRIAELRQLRSDLKQWVSKCDANADGGVCPALEALAGRLPQ